jgi:L-lactate dehydrogenase complex protein LldG
VVGGAAGGFRMSRHPGGGDARSRVLGRISDILGVRHETAPAGYQQIPRDYRTTATLGRDECLDLLAERLQHYQVDVYRAEPSTVSRTIAAALAARSKTRIIVPADIDPAWLPGGIAATPDAGLSFEELDGSEGVLTGCSFAIANTGTIVLRHAAGEGRRALTLIPDYHLCVILAPQVVHTVPEALRGVAAQRPALLTTISGPSATADIEMTRIRGVHGPRTLDVVLVI